MCRWIAYTGNRVYLEELILKPQYSLIDQSLASKLGAETTNGDGFGVGWYGEAVVPGLYKDPEPAWNNRNLADLARHIKSPLFLAHVRATTGTPIQQTNCHPFRYGRWLFVHNGLIRGYHKLKRDLVMAVDPALYPLIEGTTDSELMFNLALTFDLENEPLAALERMTGFVEKVAEGYAVEHPLQMTLGLSDGERLYAVRYSSERQSRTLFHSKSVEGLEEINPRLEIFGDDARAIVSEPLSDMSDYWAEIPESSALIVEAGEIGVHDFEPRLPS